MRQVANLLASVLIVGGVFNWLFVRFMDHTMCPDFRELCRFLVFATCLKLNSNNVMACCARAPRFHAATCVDIACSRQASS